MHFYHEHKPGEGHAFNRACGRSSGNNCDKTTAVIRKFKLRFTFTKKLLRIMQLTAIILLWACMAVSARGNTQTISISAHDASLQNVLKEVQKQSGYHIFYSYELVRQQGKVSVNVKNASLQQALDECFRGTNLTYTIIEKTIVVKQKEEKPASSAEALAKADQPPIDISGRVTDTDGNPLVGASVKVKGSSLGTTTNNDGVFVLKGVNENATLEISFVSYETITVAVNNRTSFTVSLQVKEESLNEVVINKGYYTEKQKFSVANVGKVTSRDIEKQPVNNPLLALQGRVPGLFISQSTGLPGTGVNVNVQGTNSISKGNDPLYVVDGVPYISQVLNTISSVLGNSGSYYLGSTAGKGNPLSYINPNEIESIEVLKDADATAIYGSRAANGAILITTKKGKAGKTKVDLNFQTGWGKMPFQLDLLNTQQYLQMRREAFAHDGGVVNPNWDFDLTRWDTTRYTDWQKTLLGGAASFTDAQASISGGNENTNFLVGLGNHKETTVFPGNMNDQKGSINLNFNHVSVNRKFRLHISNIYLYDNNKLPGRDLTGYAIVLAPNAPALYKSDGTLNWEPNPSTGFATWSNPLATLTYKYNNVSNNLISNTIVSYELIPGLVFKSNFGYTNLQTDEKDLRPATLQDPAYFPYLGNDMRTAIYANSNINSWISEPQITFNRNLWRGKFQALIGTTFQETSSNRQQFTGTGYNSDLVLEDVKAAATIKTDASLISKYRYNAVFGRINYNISDRYILSATARRDGSSRFGSQNMYHTFWSIGGGWIFSEEKFMRNEIPFISFGKLRASYGTTGNDQIGDYQFLSLFSPQNYDAAYQGIPVLAPNGLANPYLEWEETKKIQFGLDLGLFSDRILFNINYVLNRSSNQLLSYKLPVVTGFSEYITNFAATVQNTALEFSLSSTNIRSSHFTWRTDFNITIPKNELIAFPDLENSSYNNYLKVGEPITMVRVFKSMGVNPVSGVYQFADSSGKPTSSPDYNKDLNVIVNTSPKLYGGLENTFSYNGIELSFFVQFVNQKGRNYSIGNLLPGVFYSPGGGSTPLANQPTSVLDRWQQAGDMRSIQRYNSNLALWNDYNNANSSDMVWSDASYMRLKNVSLSWNVPKNLIRKMKLDGIKVFALGQNLFTKTNFIGLDPENQNTSSLPPLRVVTFGIKLQL